MKLILLVGLPGSGKSTYGASLGFPFLDDLSQKGGLEDLEVDPTTETLVISDHGFIQADARKAFEKVIKTLLPVTEIEYVVWENDPKICFENIQKRADGRVISLAALKFGSKIYTYPKGAKVRPVKY